MHRFSSLCLNFGLTLIISALIFTPSAQRATASIPKTNVPVIRPEIISTLPHDTKAFTQGFLYNDGYLYESTGIVGRSSLRKIDATNGELKVFIPAPGVFGEGIALFGNELVQLTWKSQIAIRYSFPDLNHLGTFRYSGEGWGLTSDSEGFIMSNGSDTLYFRDSSFETYRKLPVTLDGRAVQKLNELNYSNGSIYANVWKQNYIVEIDPESGKVLRLIDASELVRRELPLGPEQVLNGIAYNQDEDLWYLTGKEWQNIYKVRLPQ
ncbi:Glutamine cyclotransferase [Chitinispirillum alkaliphilum]|nr:Glutamine cyclotransferase [Chitinispirillum alkaliphilum]